MVLVAVSALKSRGKKNRFLGSPKGMPSLLPAPGPQANDKTLGMPPNYRNLTGKGRIGNRSPSLLVQRTEPRYWNQSSVESEHPGVRSLESQRKRPRNLVQGMDQAQLAAFWGWRWGCAQKGKQSEEVHMVFILT